MSTETLRPTDRTTPAPGKGGDAADADTDTTAMLHPIGQCSAGTLKRQSIEFHDWASSVNLQHWTSADVYVIGNLPVLPSGNDNCATARIKLQYTTNGGTTWRDFTAFPYNWSFGDPAWSNKSLSRLSVVGLAVTPVASDLGVRAWVDAVANSCPENCDFEFEILDVYFVGTFTAPTGACCNGVSCSITTEAACTGAYQGDGTVCSPNPCSGGGTYPGCASMV